MSMQTFIRTIPAYVFGMVLISSSVASAEILAGQTRAGNFGSTSITDVAVPLRQNNATTVLFTTTGPGKTLVKITFNAECTVAAARGTWVTLRIEVDGVTADPDAGGMYAFCTSIDATGNTYMSVSRQSLIRVSAGDHVVRVFARASDVGSWGLGDTSLVVEK